MDGSRDRASSQETENRGGGGGGRRRCVCLCGHQRTTLGAVSPAFASFCLTQGLSLARNFTKQPRLAGQGVSGSNVPASCLVITGITNTCHRVWPCTWVLEITLRS